MTKTYTIDKAAAKFCKCTEYTSYANAKADALFYLGNVPAVGHVNVYHGGKHIATVTLTGTTIH